LYPGSKYLAATSVLVLNLKAPTESGRIGAAAMRDRQLLGDLGKVLDDVAPVPADRSRRLS
jgi:hypothetical protein